MSDRLPCYDPVLTTEPIIDSKEPIMEPTESKTLLQISMEKRLEIKLKNEASQKKAVDTLTSVLTTYCNLLETDTDNEEKMKIKQFHKDFPESKQMPISYYYYKETSKPFMLD